MCDKYCVIVQASRKRAANNSDDEADEDYGPGARWEVMKYVKNGKSVFSLIILLLLKLLNKNVSVDEIYML